ncbi:MAG: DUF2169 domain-containing protein, partial [Planctomycetaceae bacterium]|nr:DUF2169 domain-containing protein [Planctomycetaceae bacterium]
LKLESGIAPYKPRTDVLVTATAFSPSGRGQQHWDAAVHFGEISKSFTVTGPRVFSKSIGGYRLEKPQEATSVPIRYELTYGGVSPTKDAWERSDLIAANPAGVGYYPQPTGATLPAPQVLPHGRLQFHFGERLDVVGLGPIPGHWAPRCERVGTFDALWERTRWPDLPEDFSFAFYNTASAGLTLPGFATGREVVRLVNLTPEHNTVFQLPGFELATLLRFEDGNMVPGPIHLDTVHIDAEQTRVYLTWRGVFPVNLPLRVLEVRGKDAFADRHSRSAQPELSEVL